MDANGNGPESTLSASASSFAPARGHAPVALYFLPPPSPVLLLLLLLAAAGGTVRGGRIVLPDASDATAQLYAEPGDVNVAALFPIHKPGAGRGLRCGAPREIGVLQRAEALAHAVREINANGSLLPGVRLGFYIVDDCYADSVTLAQGLRLVQRPDSCDDERSVATATASEDDIAQKSRRLDTVRQTTVEAAEAGDASPPTMRVMAALDAVAVVAAESSTNSKQLAELLSLAHVPQVSYMATSSELSDRRKYPFFTRIVPPDRQQVQAIVSLLVRMDWRYFSFVYTYNDYGLGAYMHLLEAMGVAAASGFGGGGGVSRGGGAATICMAAQRSIDVDAGESEYDETLDLLQFPPNGEKATAVVLYLTQTQAKAMLRAAKRRELHGEFVWIGSDAWGRNVQDFAGVEDVAIGSLHVKLASRNYLPFDDHFRSLRVPPSVPIGGGSIGVAPASGSGDGASPNPWLREFWVHPAAERSAHPRDARPQPPAASGSCSGSGSGDCLPTTTRDEFAVAEDNVEVHQPETTVSLVRDAVYLIARAIASLQRDCLRRTADESGTEAAKTACIGAAFRRYISPEEMQSRMRGVRECVDERYCYEVTPNGDGRRPYLIQTLQRTSDGSYELVQVGEYAQVTDSAATTASSAATTASPSKSTNAGYAAAGDALIIGAAASAASPPPLFHFSLDKAAIRWHPNATVEPFTRTPASRCADECPPHHQKLRSLDFLQFCCWQCEQCLAEEYAASSDGGSGAADVPLSTAAGGATPVCRRCDKLNYEDIVIHQRPDVTSNYTRCAPVVPEFLGGDHPIMLALAGVAAVLVTLWGVVLGCYIRFRDNRLIRATDRSLSGVMLAGVLCSYVGIFTYLAKPLSGCDSESNCRPRTDKTVCYANFLAFSVSFAFMYAPILTRSNRIYRIFNAALQPGHKPRFIESRHQLAITGAIILGQVVTLGAVFAASGSSGSPVEIRNDAYVPPNRDGGEGLPSSWLACNTRFFALAPCACYNVLLLLACAYYAFKTRKLPHNYNESRFIAFCVFSSCVLWLALVGSYFAMTSALYFSLPFVFSMLLQATLVLCCLFVPRLYALHYVVEEKVRSLSSALFVGGAGGSAAGCESGSGGGSGGGLAPTPGGGSLAFLAARDLAFVATAVVDAVAERSGGGGGRRNKARFSGDGNSTLDSVVDSSSTSDGTGENDGGLGGDAAAEEGGAKSGLSRVAAERPPAVVPAAVGSIRAAAVIKAAVLLAAAAAGASSAEATESNGTASGDGLDGSGGRGPVRTHSAAGSDYAESCDSATALRDGLLNASVNSHTPIL